MYKKFFSVLISIIIIFILAFTIARLITTSSFPSYIHILYILVIIYVVYVIIVSGLNKVLNIREAYLKYLLLIPGLLLFLTIFITVLSLHFLSIGVVN